MRLTKTFYSFNIWITFELTVSFPLDWYPVASVHGCAYGALFKRRCPEINSYLLLQHFTPANLNILIMSKKFKMKIKYSVKPQTVLTVQKENAFFAASIGTSGCRLHCISGLLRIPRLHLPPLQTKLLIRCANQRTTKPKPDRGQHHNVCDLTSCWRSESHGLGQRGPGWAWWLWWLWWWSPQLVMTTAGHAKALNILLSVWVFLCRVKKQANRFWHPPCPGRRKCFRFHGYLGFQVPITVSVFIYLIAIWKWET